MKKVLVWILAVIMCCSLFVGCANNGEAPPAEPAQESPTTGEDAPPASNGDEPLVVGYMGASAKHGFWKDVADGIEKAFTDAGIEFHQAFTEEDPVQMRLAYETFLTQGVNFIIDGNASDEKAEVFAAQAKELGIPYITIECRTESAYSYGMDNQRTGELAGAYISQLVKDEWDGQVDLIVLMSTFTYIPQLAPRVTGAYDIMKQELDIEGVEVVELSVEDDADICYQLFMDMHILMPSTLYLYVIQTNMDWQL